MRFIRQSEHIKYNNEFSLINRAFEYAMGYSLFKEEALAQAAPRWNPRLVKGK